MSNFKIIKILDKPKICATCKKTYFQVPLRARYFTPNEPIDLPLVGYYWECDCKSTLFSPTYSQDELDKLFKKAA